jgi:regulatory protein
MKITKITQQVKRAGRYSIFIDNKYSFSLSEMELIDLKLIVGQEINSIDLESLNQEALISKAKNSSFHLLSYRARSTGELNDYLKRKKYEPEIIEKVIKFLTDKKYLDDEQFAKQWIENRTTLKNASTRQIYSELRQKKINESIINKLLTNQPVDEIKLIQNIIEKKQSQPKYYDENKLIQFLSRKGFSYNNILIALGRRS